MSDLEWLAMLEATVVGVSKEAIEDAFHGNDDDEIFSREHSLRRIFKKAKKQSGSAKAIEILRKTFGVDADRDDLYEENCYERLRERIPGVGVGVIQDLWDMLQKDCSDEPPRKRQRTE